MTTTLLFDVKFQQEVQPLVRSQHSPLLPDTTVYRVLGFSKSGTTLFDLRHDNDSRAKFLCKLKADFVISFISQVTN